MRDDANREVQYANDNSGRMIGVTAVDGEVTTYGYDTASLLSSIDLPSAVAAGSTTVEFEYDTSNRITKVTQEPGIETTFAYSAGQTVVTDSNGNAATYFIDAEGRVTSTKDALNRERAQTWTANSDIQSTTDALGTNTTTYTYDGSGNRTEAQLPTGAAAAAVYAIGVDCAAPNTGTAFQPKCSTDDAGNSKQYEYDTAGNLLKQSDTTGPTVVVEFERTYGTCGGFAGQVCSTTDGNGNTTTYAYDTTGNLTTVTPPSPLGSTSYTYDSLGRVTSVTDGNGDTTGYTYDVRDRILQTTFDNVQTLTSTYYPNGLEETRSDSAGGVISFEYDHQGRILEQAGPRAGIVQTYTYDEVGNLLTLTDSTGTTTYAYDDANQLVSVQEPGGTCPASGQPSANSGCVLFAYDDNGAEITRTFPRSGAVTASVVETTRDNSGRPVSIHAYRDVSVGSIPLSDVRIGYSYVAAGTSDDRVNVQTRTSVKEEGITGGAVTTYTYDSRNRLTLANERSSAGATAPVSASWAYQYDNNSNRTSQTRTGATGATAGTIDYTYNAANQLVSATGQNTPWSYDGAGNQTANGLTGTTTSYGDRGQVTATGSTTMSSFGLGNFDRLGAGGTQFNSGALGLSDRTDSTGTHTYTRTPSGEVIGYRTSAGSFYYIKDHLGSVVGIRTGTGGFIGGYSYSPYGEARATSINATVTANAIRYIGGHHDGNGIYKLGARYYDTTLGRFTQPDPTGQEANPYAYAGCNPINSKDPSGQSSVTCIASVLVAVGASGLLFYEIVGLIGLIVTPEPVITKAAAFALGVKIAATAAVAVGSALLAIESC